MKKLYTLFLVLMLVNAYGQIINFPDPNFKAKLLQPGVACNFGCENTIDMNDDGEIDVSEAQQVWSLNISNANISDLTGISYFINLEGLNCSNNALQSLLIDSNNSSLKSLNCSNNLLQSIFLAPSVSLRILRAANNQLTDALFDVHFDHTPDPLDPEYGLFVDLSYNNLTSITADGGDYDYLNCSYNPLNTFDMNGSYIKYLYLNNTALTTIAGSGRVKIANFKNCQFELLDLTNISFYYPRRGSRVFLGNNPVDKVVFGTNSPNNLTYSSTNTFVDLGNFRGGNGCNYYPENEESGNIEIIDCPNLNFISLKNGHNYRNITCNEVTSGETWTQSTLNLIITNCPSLSFMCVDEGEQEHIQEKINAMGLQNQVQVNSYCTFTPGGTYYTVNGTSRMDADANGCYANDPAIPFQQFLITNGTQSQVISANEVGHFEINVGEGSHTISPILENPEYYSVSPASVAFNFPTDASPTQQQFCITANQSHPDLEISVFPITTARPGFDASYKVTYKNKGTQPQSGSLSFVYDDAVLDFVDAAPVVASQSVNSLQWNFTDLLPFETRTALVTLNVNSPMEVPAVNDGDIFTFNASVNSTLTDETPADNTFALSQTVVNSFDPNDKTCLEGNTVTPEMIGKYVHYLIRFENSGTAQAQNIVVKDVIDSTKFEVNSLVPLQSSHPMTTRFLSNKVEFLFENINLPFDDANNDGYVAFKIKTKPNLVLGDTFSNTADIYFDYNFPIVTNTATTTVALLANQDFDFADYFKIYPVPVNERLNIEMKKSIEVSSINIYNTLGQLVLVVPGAQQTKSVDVSGLKSGNYLVKINSDKGSSSVKFVKL